LRAVFRDQRDLRRIETNGRQSGDCCEHSENVCAAPEPGSHDMAARGRAGDKSVHDSMPMWRWPSGIEVEPPWRGPLYDLEWRQSCLQSCIEGFSMPTRAYWSGRIRLALVSIPVEVLPATKSTSRISFNQIHEPTGKRIRYEKVVPGVGPVEASEIVKGYEVEKNKYVLLTDEEINDVKLEAKKSIDLTAFVDEDAIDAVYFDRPFYIVPSEEDEDAAEAYIVLRDALRKS
jgi:hypothetical protein